MTSREDVLAEPRVQGSIPVAEPRPEEVCMSLRFTNTDEEPMWGGLVNPRPIGRGFFIACPSPSMAQTPCRATKTAPRIRGAVGRSLVGYDASMPPRPTVILCHDLPDGSHHLDWMSALDRAGELKRVRTEVDPILEITEIADRVGQQRIPIAGRRQPIQVGKHTGPAQQRGRRGD